MSMKKFDFGNQRSVPTKSMMKKRHEERFYKELEKTFKDIKRQEYKASKKIAAVQLKLQME